MGNRKGVELLQYAIRELGHCSDDFNRRWTAEELLRIADALQKCEYEFPPDTWTERQLQECVQLGITPKWTVEKTPGGGAKYVPVYHNESTKLKEILEEAAFETREYSGKGMYGKKCLGVVVNVYGNPTAYVAGVLLENLEGVSFDEIEEIGSAFKRAQCDQMGKGHIVYFPSVAYEKGDEG